MKKVKAMFVLLSLVFLFAGCSGASESSNGSSEVSSKKSESSESVKPETSAVDLTESLVSFEKFTDEYESLEKGQRTPSWEKIAKSEVVWSGKVIDSTNHTLVIVRTDKWEKGMDWNNVQKNPKDPYYVFIADFNNDIDSSAYPSGTEVTIKGSLDSRGDPDMPSNWKLYNCEIQ